MKTATITLSVTPGIPMPENEIPFAAQAGFRLTLTRNSTEASLSTPVEDKLTWVIGNFVEGEVYSLLVEAVDSEGRVIQSLPSTTIEVPAAPTFTRVDGFNVAWN
jgi:hypothetical protein